MPGTGRGRASPWSSTRRHSPSPRSCTTRSSPAARTGGWSIGASVRKLANRVRGEILVGVEVLAYRPIPIGLTPADGSPTQALYLPGVDPNGKLDSILVRAGDFRSNQGAAIRIG